MVKKYFITICFLLSTIIAFSSTVFAVDEAPKFDYLDYPKEAVTEYLPDFLNRVSTGDDYISNMGYNDTCLYISPYWKATVNSKNIPIYSTLVYDSVLGRGVLESFQYIFIDKDKSYSIEMEFVSTIKNAVILPEKSGLKCEVNGNKLSFTVSETGTYTILINNDSQEYALTFFIRENVNENDEIKLYREKYGAENVIVYEKGVYNIDTLEVNTDVLYLKRGAFISANHIKDIRSQADADNANIPAFLSLYDCKNKIITGYGTVDFNKVDRQERGLVNLNYCENCTLEGLIILNSSSWTCTTYACDNCTLNDITVFGYRTNSDGINICGSSNMNVTNSFCRNGDDCFSVKTTNTYYESHDILFENCIGWTNKARCFGITGEVERDIYNITFRDCSVVYRNATWDLDRAYSLAIAVEYGSGNIDNILFEDIEIYKDLGRPINCIVYGKDITDCQITNVVFRNVSYNANEKIKISSQRNISLFGNICAKLNKYIKCKWLTRFYDDTNSIDVTFENVKANGKKLNRFNILSQGNTITHVVC